MKTLLDTSVLVGALIEPHAAHDRCLPWLQRARGASRDTVVAAHSLAELFAVLSAYPVRPRISPELAARAVRQNVSEVARIVPLSAGDYDETIREASELGLSGGVIYDALIVRAARKAEVDRIVTLNRRDLVRVWPAGSARIVEA